MSPKRKGEEEEESPCRRNYKFPIFGAAFVPTKHIDSTQDESISWVIFSGGGGDTKSGVANAIVLAQFDSSSNSLSPHPMSKLEFGADVPYRMAVHPGGEGVVCSFPTSCRWFEWVVEADKLNLKSSEKVLTQLEDIGEQSAITFNIDGSALAVGGEDGHLRVFMWPTMEVVLDDIGTGTAVKDLSFSSNGKFLVSLSRRGPCSVWDVSSSRIVASLAKESDEDFGSCRFSQTKDHTEILYITAMRGQGGRIIVLETNSWKRIQSKQIVRSPVSAFNVSLDGELLAVGTNGGDIHIVNSRMQGQMIIKRAHPQSVTSLMFSEDSRSLVSGCWGACARVTLIQKNKEKQTGLSILGFLFIVLLAILAYYVLKIRLAI